MRGGLPLSIVPPEAPTGLLPPDLCPTINYLPSIVLMRGRRQTYRIVIGMRGWKAAGQTVLEASMSDERLTELLAGVGRRYGYRKVKARFKPLDGAKVRWRRSGGSVRLEVSDFLAAATDREMCEIADAVFRSIAVKGWDPADSEELVSLGR